MPTGNLEFNSQSFDTFHIPSYPAQQVQSKDSDGVTWAS